ncbi:Thiolase, N-terminal domain-containing protein [Alternaria rosae]|uniref:Thiolase, N-terminal domain-containing protein n=1 Tax=Alternaria rosae TaxID=1187941 RepID=UPI001E8EEE4E|nr:Thiolase, N-terminal domain-containing protein [Alternaria rosae]KAH6881483.1 Thiolase, N-terminal domain-containing protein [Alternaria rosae]
MSSSAFRTSMRVASRPQQRLASIQRQFSSSAPQRKEIRDAYIISASRTPTAVFNGNFTTVSATQLGATAIKSALEKSKVPISSIDAVYMGNVLSGGVGQAPARQAAIFAGLPTNIEATTINKVCASGLKAVNIAASTIELGQAEAQVAGGMENMTRVPYYLNRASQQPAFGHQKLQDGLIADGLWDVYNQIHMGNCAENTAKKYEVSRQDQDDYAIETYKRAQQAYKDGLFKDEIVPVTVKSKKGETIISEDEQYNKLKLDKVSTLKPAFEKGPDGSVTAANSSPLSDGASALILGSKEIAQKYGKDSRVLAKVVTYADAAVDPIDFPVAPASCVEKLLKQSGLSKNDIAIWEFNEAFAAVIKANAKILGLGTDNVNPRGGAIALGHALGSSGSRILVTLLHQLQVGQYGAAVICNGGGAASGIIVQRVSADEL